MLYLFTPLQVFKRAGTVIVGESNNNNSNNNFI